MTPPNDYVKEAREERRTPKWFDKWTNPTVVFTLIGGIVWGSNMNAYVMRLGDDRDELKEAKVLLLADVKTLQFDDAKTTLVLDALVKQMNITSDQVQQHVRDDRRFRNELEKRFDKVEHKLLINGGP